MAVDSSHRHVCDACVRGINLIDSRESDAIFERYRREAGEHGIEPFFNGALTCWHYGGVGRQLILAMKYGRCDFLFDDLAAIIKKNSCHAVQFIENSVLVPVPLHYIRHVYRDYSQTELLASSLAKHTNARVARGILRCKNHVTQTSLHPEDRWLNVSNTFSCSACRVNRNARIVIIDDVITTGATMLACCAAMHLCGFRDINVLTISNN
jgi:ComF family protein